MAEFFAELKRRQVFRVAAAYAVVAWLLLQIVNNVAPGLNLPNWAVTFVIVLLAIGFPVALLFCWIQQLVPGGDVPQVKTNRLDWILAGGLAAVIALILYQQLAPSPGAGTATQATFGPPAPSQTQSSGISIAVLPLVNLSDDRAQEFFSDGMTEEITSALTRLRGLRVVGRTSAFQFKGQSQDLRAIGQALSAGYLIEGSVRRAGDQVRITAQLIKADDGTQVWTGNYNRQLTDIFAIQEEIAQAIAGALRVPLGLAQGERLVSDSTDDLDSYQQYLRARAMVRARAIADAIAVLEPVVARDPQFAPASALLAQAYLLLPLFSPLMRSDPMPQARVAIQSLLDKAEAAAQRAIESAPKSAAGYSALANIRFARGQWTEADDGLRQALALDPGDPDALNAYSALLGNVGRLEDALRLREQIRELEPFVPIYNILIAAILRARGENAAAIPILEATPPDPGVSYVRNVYLAWAYAGVGRFAEAADALLAIQGNLVSRQSVEDAAKLLRGASLSARPSQAPPAIGGGISFVYAHAGALERIMELPERALALNYFGLVELTMIWAPEYAPLRKTERFRAFVRTAGYIDYWRAKGWPDLCRPVGADDFVCD